VRGQLACAKDQTFQLLRSLRAYNSSTALVGEALDQCLKVMRQTGNCRMVETIV
jgi:hypothetical protein